ncbi:MAG: DUF1456 family protein [Myxococcota bacterium]
MIHNDVLRRLRYALDLDDAQAIRLFALSGVELDPTRLAAILAREGADGFESCTDRELGGFLDGLVLDRRGPRDPSAPAPRPTALDNNQILKKLRIALKLEERDMIAILNRGGMSVTPSELGALFRNPGHKHYRACGDQLLRKFLDGLTHRLRPDAEATARGDGDGA